MPRFFYAYNLKNFEKFISYIIYVRPSAYFCKTKILKKKSRYLAKQKRHPKFFLNAFF